MKILVAANDKNVRSALITLINCISKDDILTESGHSLNLLEQLRKNKTDLVIIEWNFFINENEEMMYILKQAYPYVPFIATGISMQNRENALKANMDAFYIMSDSPDELIKLINRFRKDKNI